MNTTELFDARQLRNVLGRFFTGVTIVTTVDDNGKFRGVTANSFTSVSLDPPLILWNQAIKSNSHSVFRNQERFAINILAESQLPLSKRFAGKDENRFEGVSISTGLAGIPLIDGCCATLECRKVTTHDGGDHAVFIGMVERLRSNDQSPLIFGDGQYMAAQSLDLAS